MPSAHEGIPGETGAAQYEPGDGGGQDDQGEWDGEEIECHEGQDREANEHPVIDGALADPQDRLDHDRYNYRLYAVQKTRYRRHVRVGHGQVREEPQHEDRWDHEEEPATMPPNVPCNLHPM